MKKLLLLLSVASITTAHAQSVTRLLACSPFDNLLEVLDTNSYVSVYTRTLTAPGVVDGITGLAKHPGNGDYYTVAKTANSRWLGTLNPLTGSITIIGNLVDNFSHITFNGNNTLLGVTGQGASVPCTVYRINTTNANKSFLKTLPNAYGQVICYNPTDNRVYHWSGGTPDFDSYDTTFVTSPTSLTISPSGTEILGAVHKSANTFVTNDWNNEFRSTGASGTITSVTNNSVQVYKGLAYITCSRTITASAGAICNGSPATLTMSGVLGATYQWYRNGVLIGAATSQTYAATTVGNYNCVITDGCGMDSLSAGVKLISGTLPTVTITGAASICPGQTLELVGSTGGASQWYKNGTPISGANTNSYVVNSPGVYNMIKTNTNGCKDSATVGKTVSLVPNPTVMVNVVTPTVCASQPGTITATGASNYTWSNGTNANAVVITITTTTTYTVTGEQGGCFGSASATQYVDICAGLTKQSLGSPLINLFPNPASETLNIESEQGIGTLEIIDLTGKVLLKENAVHSTTYTIDVRSLPAALYFVKVTHNNGAVSQLKFSVQ